MKIVVTGALGHIGSQLIRALPFLTPGTEICLIDDLSTQRHCSLFGLPPQGKYRFIEADVLRAPLHEYFSGADVVIHLAAITNATTSFANRETVERVNFNATARVAEACLVNSARLLFVSTTSVYGTQREEVDEACPESDLRPQSPYAETKPREETLLKEMHSRGLKHVTCRFGTIFGVSPGMRFHTAVNKFCWQATHGQPATVWTHAIDQVRPYLDLNDAIRAIHFLIERNAFEGEIYNILSLNATVSEIVNVIRERIPELKIDMVDEVIMNQFSYRVSRAKFEKVGFHFKGDLRKAIFETLELLSNTRTLRP